MDERPEATPFPQPETVGAAPIAAPTKSRKGLVIGIAAGAAVLLIAAAAFLLLPLILAAAQIKKIKKLEKGY